MLRPPNKAQTAAAFVAGTALHLIVDKFFSQPPAVATAIGLHLAAIIALLYALLGLIRMIRKL